VPPPGRFHECEIVSPAGEEQRRLLLDLLESLEVERPESIPGGGGLGSWGVKGNLHTVEGDAVVEAGDPGG
jgi:hypothetical protein